MMDMELSNYQNYKDTLEKEIPNLKIELIETNQYGYSHVAYLLNGKGFRSAGVTFDKPIDVKQETRSILSVFNQL